MIDNNLTQTHTSYKIAFFKNGKHIVSVGEVIKNQQTKKELEEVFSDIIKSLNEKFNEELQNAIQTNI